MQKERKISSRNQKAIASMPNRKEREEIDGLKETVERLKEELRAREKKSKLTFERQKKQISEMKVENDRLREEV
jgi:hypothetical protein